MKREINLSGLERVYADDIDMAKMGTVVLDRQQVLNWKPAEKYPLISIRDRDEQALDPSVKANYSEVVELVFSDIIESNSFANRLLMSDDDAGVIVNFLRKYEGKPLLVHCRGGVSRSSGVALARGILFNDWDLVKRIVSSDKYSANPTVVRRLLGFAAFWR